MTNRTIFTGDNLDVLRGFNSGCVDLIYLDPPFNSRREYSAPVGSKAAGAAFADTWHWDDVDAAWLGEVADAEPRVAAVVEAAGTVHGRGMKSYLLMMGVRLLELRRVLKPTGSIWLHCDPTANSYLRLLMDAVFGKSRLPQRDRLVLHRSGSPKRALPIEVDTLYFYAGEGPSGIKQFTPFGEKTKRQYNKRDEDGRRYRKHSLRADGTERRLYLDEAKGIPVRNWWADIVSFAERPRKRRSASATPRRSRSPCSAGSSRRAATPATWCSIRSAAARRRALRRRS